MGLLKIISERMLLESEKEAAAQAGKPIPDQARHPLAIDIPSKTVVDRIIESIQSEKRPKISDLAKRMDLDVKSVEVILKSLSDQGIVRMNYPLNIWQQPTVSVGKIAAARKEMPLPKNKKLLDSYTVTADYVRAKINIWYSPERDIPIYEVVMPTVEPATQALLNSIMHTLVQTIPISAEDISDPKKIVDLKKTFYEAAFSAIKLGLPTASDDQIRMFAGMLLHKMYGLGDMEILLNDDLLEEVAVNGSSQPFSLYHKKHGWVESTQYAKDEDEIYNFAAQIGRKVNREITSLNPIMDAHLLTGDRVTATLFPISTSGNTLTIRRFSRNPWTIVHFIDPKVKCFSPQIAAFLWLAVQYEFNVMVAGGTASGKTSVLNAVASLIPANQRIISIEDTREITLPDSLTKNYVPLTSRNPNPEGKGGISMLDLMVASLRMRPDRIIVGEVRTGKQAEAMFEAMHTGHSVCSTIHADTVAQAVRRLIEPPIKIPKSEVESLHLILVQYRDRRKGMRRMLELAEIASGEDKIDVRYLYRWLPGSDVFEKTNESIRVIEELNLHTGMTIKEINQDLKDKEIILRWMLKRDIKDVNPVGKIMRIYYKEPKTVITAARNNAHPNTILSK